jgi:hypothetical protein
VSSRRPRSGAFLRLWSQSCCLAGEVAPPLLAFLVVLMGQISETLKIKGKRYYSQDYRVSRKIYRQYRDEITSKWSRPDYMFTGKPGGHVAALRVHLPNSYFAVIDLADYYETITDTKIYRSLLKIGVNKFKAFKMAGESTVSFKNTKVLARGLSQSSILADLVFDQSLLGSVIKNKISSTVSVYCDDIILSGNDYEQLNVDLEELLKGIVWSRFEVNFNKSTNVSTEVKVFNLVMTKGNLRFTSERLIKFADTIKSFLLFASRVKRYRPLDFVDEIIDYTTSINVEQGLQLKKFASISDIYQNFCVAKKKKLELNNKAGASGKILKSS